MINSKTLNAAMNRAGYLEAKTENNIVAFEVGKTYRTRSTGDHNCIIEVTIAKRTKCFITTTGGERFKVKNYKGSEEIRPWGNYSMCPFLYATDTQELKKDWE